MQKHPDNYQTKAKNFVKKQWPMLAYGLMCFMLLFSVVQWRIENHNLNNNSLSRSLATNEVTRLCRKEQATCRFNYECCQFSCQQGICQQSFGFSNRKLYIGEKTRDAQDCQSALSFQGICVASESLKAKTFQYCRSYRDCESFVCDGEKNVCLGSTFNPYPKASFGQYCTNDRQCLSGKCHPSLSFCLGGPKNPARVGEFCDSPFHSFANQQCESRRCSLRKNKCI